MMKKEQKKRMSPGWTMAISGFLILAGLSYCAYTYYHYMGPVEIGRGEWEGERGGGPGEWRGRGEGDRLHGPPPMGPPPGEGPAPGIGGGPGGGEDFRQRMAQELNLTQEQQQKIQEIWQQGRPQSREEAEKRMESMRNILTPAQQQQAMAAMGGRMDRYINSRVERAKRILPPDQLKLYEQRLRERAQAMRNRMSGRPGGGPGGGAPPIQAQPGQGGR